MNKCNIVRDLLPLYEEGLLSKDSIEFVNNHIEECEECNKLNRKEDFKIFKDDEKPLNFLRDSITKEKNRYGKSIVLGCLSIFIIILFFLTKPIHFENETNLYEVNSKNKEIMVTFRDDVTNANVYNFGEDIYIEANTSILDKFFKRNGKITLSFDRDKRILYSNHNDNADLIFGEKINGGVQLLPRLVLNYFLKIAIIVLLVLTVMFMALRNRLNLVWKLRIIAIPISFILGFISIKGFKGASYYPVRELCYILLISFSYYMLFNSIYNIKKSKI